MSDGTEWDILSVVKVVDGDSIHIIRSRVFDVDGRLHRDTDADPEGFPIRLVWVDTPERGDHPGWENARADLAQWIADHSIHGMRIICYKSAGWDRLLGDVLDAEGNSASQWLMTVKNWPPYIRGKAR